MIEQKDPATATFSYWENGFSAAELDSIVKLGDTLVDNKAAILAGNNGALEHEIIRVTRTSWIDFKPETEWLFKRVEEIVRVLNNRTWKFDLTSFSESFQYSVYHDSERGHYDWHIDQGPLKVRRKLSLTVQLSDDSVYTGGDLQFQAGNALQSAPRTRGTVIAFPSYVLHRVSPVTAGTRKSLVVWTTGPQFR